MLYALIGHVKTTRFTGGYYYLDKQDNSYLVHNIIIKLQNKIYRNGEPKCLAKIINFIDFVKEFST